MNTYELEDQEGLRQRNSSQEKTPFSHNERDEAAIAKFGKKQQLRRRFKSLSLIGLTCGLMLTWEAVIFNLLIGLSNGGTAGLVYGYIAAWLGATLQSLVMAELASMIPLAGGPFNWVAILAPPSSRKFLSYIAGWLTMIAYQALVASVAYICASLVQSLIILNHPSYVPKLWHATLIFYAVIAFGVVMNTIFGRLLPRIESLLLIFYVLGFFGVLIPVTYLAPHRSAKEVFTTFYNGGEWSSMSLSFFVGWLGSVSCFMGNDGPDHIAEEVQDAQKVLPFSIWFSTFFNGLLGFAIIIVMTFCMGNISNEVLFQTNFPFIPIFEEALGSKSGGLALSIIATAIVIFSVNCDVATASRMLWAFSRENGLPFSGWIAKVDPKSRIPLNAVVVTVVINVLIALISVGSTVAFQALLSVNVVAYFSSFILAAGIMLHKRLTTANSEIPWGPFRLGKAGIPITIFALIYTVWALFFSFWPTTSHVEADTMNYSVLIFGAAVLFSLIFWAFWGRKTYVGPIWELQSDGEYIRAKE